MSLDWWPNRFGADISHTEFLSAKGSKFPIHWPIKSIFEYFSSLVFIALCQYTWIGWTATNNNWYTRMDCPARPHTNYSSSFRIDNWLFYTIFLVLSVIRIIIVAREIFRYLSCLFLKVLNRLLIPDAIVDLQTQHIHQLFWGNWVHRMKWPFIMAKRYSFTESRAVCIFWDFWLPCMYFA